MMRKMIGKVFTLIELLVVIAIISILMTILLPALKKARERTKDVLCLSNQKQTMLALISYSNDFSGFIPLWYDPVPKYCWSTTLMKSDYIIYEAGNGGINMPDTFLTCPSMYPYGKWRSEGYTYGLRTSNEHINLVKMAMSKYRGPMIADSIQKPSADPVRTWYHFYTAGGTDSQMIDCRHNSKANVGFEDGSARAIGSDYFAEWADRANAYFYYHVNGVVRNGYND